MALAKPLAPGPTRAADKIFLICMALSLIGMLTLMSAGAFIHSPDGDAYRGDPYRLLKRQGLCLLVAIAAYCVVRQIPLRVIDRVARAGVLAAVFLLILVLLPGIGTEEGNASRWFRIGSVSVQPSEFA